MKSISCQEDVGLASGQSNNQQVITFISETVESTKKRLKAQYDRDCQHVPSNGIKKLRVRKQIKIPKLLENFFVFKTCSPCTHKSHSLTTTPLTSACDVTSSKYSQKSHTNPSHKKESLESAQSISNYSDSFYLGFPLFIISNSHNITRPNNMPTISTCNQDNTFNSSLQSPFSPIIRPTPGDEWRGLLPLLDAHEVMREWEDLHH